MNRKRIENTSPRQKRKNLWLAFGLFLTLLILLGAGIFFAERMLFSRNQRFLLRRVEIRSEQVGYWHNRDERLTGYLRLTPGRDNLWQLDLRELREKLLRHPSVKSCTMTRVLPDKLVVSIVERLPRAALGNPGSPYLLSDDLVVLLRSESMPIADTLPVLTGFPPAFRTHPGALCQQAEPAMRLIMEILRNFPDLAPLHLDLASPDKLQASLRYRNRHLYRVTLPVDGRFDYLLGVVQSAIIDLLRNGDPRTVLDVSFNGQVVIR